MAKPSLFDKIDFVLFGWIINLAYSEYYRPKYGYEKYYRLFFFFFIPQKIFRINGSAKWPVHFSSKINSSQNIKKGINCDPGDSPGVYIQANNGIKLGSNVGFSPGVKVISSNHSLSNYKIHSKCSPIMIGDNVWVGANSVILPSVNIGDNVVIGAGSVVSKNIPSNSIAVGNPCKVIKSKGKYNEDFSKVIFNRKIPEKYKEFLN